MEVPVAARLLQPAVEAARSALRRLDDDAVPAALKRIAASSARRLPAPLEARLLGELDGDAWLRGEALSALRDHPTPASPATTASELFLGRPPGWEADLRQIDGDETEKAARRDRAELDRENQDLRRRLEQMGQRLSRAEEESRRAAAAPTEGRDEERLRRRVAELHAEVGRREAARRAVEDELAELARELVEADTRISELRDALLRSRRDRGDGTGAAGGTSFGRGSPVETAQALDQFHAALIPRRAPAAAGAGGRGMPELGDVAPDRPEAIDWLLRVEVPTTLLVDGYNVAYELTSSPDVHVRTRLTHGLARIRRLADGPITPILFWDSAEEAGASSISGVVVRFVASADDAIVESVLGGGAVVVSGDREVRERSEERGAICLWASALAGWIRR